MQRPFDAGPLNAHNIRILLPTAYFNDESCDCLKEKEENVVFLWPLVVLFINKC